MQNDRRQFYIFNLELAARKAGATIPSMNDIVPVFQRMKDAARTYTLRLGTATMLIGDIETNITHKYIVLLIRLSDKTAPNSVYSDPASGHFNEHVKPENVGSDFGCHVFISTEPEKTLPNTYTCVIERVSGIPSDLVRRLLSKLLHLEYRDDATFFSYLHPAGGVDANNLPRRDRCCPHVELRGRPSDTLVNDINAGRISSISLIKTEPVTPIAGAAYLKKSKLELTLGIDHNNLPANLWASLSQVFRGNSREYNAAQVKYKAPESNRVVSVEFDTNTCTPLTDSYVLSFEVDKIRPLLAQSSMHIVPHLRDLAVPKFLANRTI